MFLVATEKVAYIKTISGNVSGSRQCAAAGVTKIMVCTVLSVGGAYKRSLAAGQKENHRVLAMGINCPLSDP